MTNFEQLQLRFDTLIAEQQVLRLKFITEAQTMFKESLKSFFELNPGINALRWTQYTPYFNDGDACVFSVGDVYFTNAKGNQLDDISGWGEYEGDDADIWSDSYPKYLTGKLGVNVESCEFISSMINSSEMEDIMEMMFGDHVCVTVTRVGIDVTDYDHD
jgi:hypothetical protein